MHTKTGKGRIGMYDTNDGGETNERRKKGDKDVKRLQNFINSLLWGQAVDGRLWF